MGAIALKMTKARWLAGAASFCTLLGTGVWATGAPRALPDAPFVALAAGHVNKPYNDTVADAFDVPCTSFHLVAGALPVGLSLDAATGAVQGSPHVAGAARVRVAATPVSGGGSREVRAQVAIFRDDERELVRGQDFQGFGPYAVHVRSESFNWTSSFDGQTRPAKVLIYVPYSRPIIRWEPWKLVALTRDFPKPSPLSAAAAKQRTLDTIDPAASVKAHRDVLKASGVVSPLPPVPAPPAPLPLPALPARLSIQRLAINPALVARPLPLPFPRSRFPLIVFHRGRGFGHDDYDNLFTRIASHGIVIASVSDEQSFYSPRNPGAAEPAYDWQRAELGMYSASAAQEATMNYVLGLAATPGDSLCGKVDPDEVFFQGHSRGGGATHASHVRSIPLRVKGVIYFMAYDLRNFNNCRPPAVAPAYPIATAQPRLPSLVIAAERDGDLSYPIADQFIDRATGPTTFVTVYGGNHDNLGDDNDYDGWAATISREDEQKRVTNFVVAFVKRWTYDDVSLEGFLYGDEHATSNTVGVGSWRRTSPGLLVDDFQDGNAGKNLLGGSNTVVNMRRTEESIYPPTGDMPSLGLKHCVLTPLAQDSSFKMALSPPTLLPWVRTLTLSPALGAAIDPRVATLRPPFPWNKTRDLRGFRALLVRAEQTGSDGWKIGCWAQLRDAFGRTASVKVSNEDGSSTGFLPAFTGGGAPLNRFVTVTVPIDRFRSANPALLLDRVSSLELVVHTPNATPDPSRKIVLDDVRFE